MANDLARYGIRVNAVAPGPVDTPMVQKLHSAQDRALWAALPAACAATARPRRSPCAIEFLLDGTKSGYVTGEIVGRRRRLPRRRRHR